MAKVVGFADWAPQSPCDIVSLENSGSCKRGCMIGVRQIDAVPSSGGSAGCSRTAMPPVQESAAIAMS